MKEKKEKEKPVKQKRKGPQLRKKNEQHQELKAAAWLQALVTEVLKAMQESCDLASCCAEMWLGVAKLALVKTLKRQISSLVAFMGMIEGDVEAAGEAEEFKKKVQPALDEAEGRSLDALAATIKSCKCAKCFLKDKGGVILWMTDQCSVKKEMDEVELDLIEWFEQALP